MNVKTTLVLLLLVVVVGGYFLFFMGRDEPAAHDRPEPSGDVASKLLTAEQLPSTEVMTVTLDLEGEQAVVEKRGKDWMQISPVLFPMNTWEIDQVISGAAALRYTDRFKPGGTKPTLDRLGLEPPRATVTYHRDDGELTLFLGRTTGPRGYVMVEGDPHVYVVDDALHQRLLDKTPRDLRRASVVVPQEGQVRTIEISQDDDPIVLHKGDDGWSFSGSHAGRVSRSEVRELLSAVRSMYIRKFIADAPDDLALYGLADPAVTVTIEHELPDTDAQDGEPTIPTTQTLRIGTADLQGETYFATWDAGENKPAVVFAIGNADVSKFRRSADSFRDPRMAPINQSQVRKVRIDRGDRVIAMAKDPEAGWVFATPMPDFELDEAKANELLKDLLAINAVTYVVNPPLDRDPAITLEFDLIGVDAPRDVRLFPYNGTRHLAIYDAEPVGYVIENDALEPATQPVAALRERQLLEVDPEAITRLAWQPPGGVGLPFERDDEGAWKVAEGGQAFEQPALERLVRTLATLKADDWVLDADEITGPTLAVQAHLADRDPVRLRFTHDGSRGRIEGVPHVFSLSENDATALAAELRDRTWLDHPLENLSAVVLGDVTVTRGEGGVYTADGDLTLDESAAGELFNTLAGLRVQRYVAPSLAGLDPDTPTHEIRVRLVDGDPVALRVGRIVGPLYEGRWFVEWEDQPDVRGILSADVGEALTQDLRSADEE